MRRPSAARPGQPRAAPSLIPDVPWILGGTQDATKKLALTRSVPGLRGSPGTPLASKTSESREVFTAGKPIFWWGKMKRERVVAPAGLPELVGMLEVVRHPWKKK